MYILVSGTDPRLGRAAGEETGSCGCLKGCWLQPGRAPGADDDSFIFFARNLLKSLDSEK
jgi:hypothetical protein